MIIALLILAAYVLGSIPSAVWIGRRFHGIDVREHGSRNAGATNTLRVLGRRAALTVFAMDVLKGFAAVNLALLMPEGGFWLELALTAAVVTGHIFPVLAGFRGGKGVATLAGAVLAINPLAVGLCLLAFVIVLFFSHYVSLGSMSAGVLLPLLSWLTHRSVPEMLFSCLITALLIFMHRRNIGRLLARTESKIYMLKYRQVKNLGQTDDDNL